MALTSSASGNSAAVTRICFDSRDNLTWLSTDATLRRWRASRLSPPHHVSPANHLAVSDSFVTTSDVEQPRVRHLETRAFALRHVTRTERTTGTVIAISRAVHNEGQELPNGYFAVQDTPFIRVHAYTGNLLTSVHGSAPIFSAALSDDGNMLATGDSAGIVRVYAVHDGAAGGQKLRAHRRAVSGVALMENHVVSVGWDGRLVVSDLQPKLATKASRRVEPSPGRLHAVATGGGFIAAAGDSATVRVWKVPENDKQLETPFALYDAHSAAIYALAFSHSARLVASGCADGTVRLLGVPTPPVLISGDDETEAITTKKTSSPWDPKPSSSESQGPSLLHVTPVDTVTTTQSAHRRLIFCPSRVVNLECPVCATAYDAKEHAPMCSGVCGHTFACATCCERLLAADDNATCPICRRELRDVAPNYELLRILEAASGTHDSSETPQDLKSKTDFIDSRRLTWLDDNAVALSSLHCCVLLPGTMDGDPVSIRVPRRREEVIGNNALFRGDASAIEEETTRHLARVRSLHAPHIVSLYGVSREPGRRDDHVIAVGELPSAGTLASNLDALRRVGGSLGARGVVALAVQLVRAVRSLHEAGLCAGHALSPRCIGVDSALTDGWGSQGQRLKLLELGGTRTAEELITGGALVLPAHFMPYLAPEALDQDASGSVHENADSLLLRAQQADMYAVGVVLWQIATLNPPFEGLTTIQVIARVVGRDERPGFLPGWLPPDIRELIARLWATKPVDRPDCFDACSALEQIPSAPPPIMMDEPVEARSRPVHNRQANSTPIRHRQAGNRQLYPSV